MKRRKFFKTIGLGSLAAFPHVKMPGTLIGHETPPRPASEAHGHMDPWIDVNLDHIRWNFAQIKNLVKVPVMAVVKANAYGHGLIDVGKALEKAGADWLMVGKLQEGLALRATGVRCPILNFGPFDARDCEAIILNDLSQSVFSEEAVTLNDTASRLKKRALVHIDIDTGMSRTGIPHDRALPLIEKIATLSQTKIEGVSTTLTEDAGFDKEQLERFLKVCRSAQKKKIQLGLKHAASSAGIFESAELYLDMVRPGITLYGYYPNSQTQKEDRLNLRPALKLTARVTVITDLQPGDSISYHRVFTARKKMRVATVGIGYSDGYAPQLGGKGIVLIRGKRFPVMDAVTANHIIVDLNNDREIQVGGDVTLIDGRKDSGLTADRLADLSGISDYRILIGLNPLVQRKYTSPERAPGTS